MFISKTIRNKAVTLQKYVCQPVIRHVARSLGKFFHSLGRAKIIKMRRVWEGVLHRYAYTYLRGAREGAEGVCGMQGKTRSIRGESVPRSRTRDT